MFCQGDKYKVFPYVCACSWQHSFLNFCNLSWIANKPQWQTICILCLAEHGAAHEIEIPLYMNMHIPLYYVNIKHIWNNFPVDMKGYDLLITGVQVFWFTSTAVCWACLGLQELGWSRAWLAQLDQEGLWAPRSPVPAVLLLGVRAFGKQPVALGHKGREVITVAVAEASKKMTFASGSCIAGHCQAVRSV